MPFTTVAGGAPQPASWWRPDGAAACMTAELGSVVPSFPPHNKSAFLPFTARSLPHAPKQIVSHLFWNCYMLIILLRIIHYLPMKRFGFPQRAEKQSAEEALENS